MIETTIPLSYEKYKNNDVDVSIIIVNWNTRKLLVDCISSIYENVNNLNFEIIVVDNASSDGSVEMINFKFPKVKIIVNTKNMGFAAANNQGILTSKGRYILLLNSDTLVLKNSLQKTVVFADCHEKVGIVGCRVLNPDNSLQPTCFMFPSVTNMLFSSTYLHKLFPENRLFARERMTWWKRNDVRQVDVVTGCFMLIRRKAIKKVGLMDEQFFMYAEETDLCYRFKQAGWKVMFTPDAQIIHFGGQSSRKFRPEMLIQLRLSILKFIKKHQGGLKHKIASLLTIMFFALRIPIWFLTFVFVHKYKQQASVKLYAYLNGIRQIFIQLSSLIDKTVRYES